eukprot:CAMPEP_0119004638 /NCGR_PEP_ID=MMETSP1176-20130426/1265_1 /TAXON_ID=265551 /ORGANISM="Synedropsis recta cf, Strain CCMP1620" /LENGTH=174 /DNA_ID=CAMNT_0006956373 /DNA_START=44 /DNA_END=568 /DNA_ORIENTATION=-
MMSSRFLKFLLLALVLTVTVSQDAAAATEAATEADCSTPGECANPAADVEDVVEHIEEPVIAKVEEPVAPVVEEDPSCPSRPHIIRCAAKYLDTNKNNKLDREELETAIDALPWLARGVLRIIGSVNTIMKKCDYDEDGAISIDYDMDQTTETCLASCFKRRAFKSAFFADCDL